MERLSEESFYTGYVFPSPRDEYRNTYGYRTIYFGKNMMPWLLLDCDEEAALTGRDIEKALLLSKYTLCNMQHYEEPFLEEMSWMNSEIRRWLNNEFLEECFDETDQKAILQTSISTTAQWHSLDGVIMDTQWEVDDKIFLLSEAEVNKYFPGFGNELFRRIAKGIMIEKIQYWKNKAWWLRDRGGIPFDAKYVDTRGHIQEMNAAGKRFYRDRMIEKYISVRPAMWVSIEALLNNPNVCIDSEKEMSLKKKRKIFMYTIFSENWVKAPDDKGDGLLQIWLRERGELCTLLIETHNVSLEDVEIGNSQVFEVVFESKSNMTISSSPQGESFISSGLFEQTPTVVISGTVTETYGDSVEYGFEEGDTLLTINCLGNSFDLVIHEEHTPGEKPQIGDNVSGEFWVQGWPGED